MTVVDMNNIIDWNSNVTRYMTWDLVGDRGARHGNGNSF